jgi:hypothetical protein
MTPNTRKSKHIPLRPFSGDIISIFILIMCFAFAWQAINAMNLYADIRNSGHVQGRWVTTYVDPFDDTLIATYSFVIDDKTYRGRQPNPAPPNQFAKNDPVDIVYSMDNPKQARVAGTEGYRIQNLVELIVSVMIGFFTIQYMFAYYTESRAWILILARR